MRGSQQACLNLLRGSTGGAESLEAQGVVAFGEALAV